MKYYITYKLKNDPNTKYIGPFNEFHYMNEVTNLIAQDNIYNVDIVNEVAMECYFEFLSVEKEYKEAKERWEKYPPSDKSFTIQDEVNLSRELKLSLEDFVDNMIKKEPDINDTLSTISTLKSVENGFDNWDDDIPF